MAFMTLLDEMYNIMRIRAEERNRQASTIIQDVAMNATTDPTATTHGPTVLGSQQRSPKKTGPSTPNYNVIMTLDHIFLFPRSSEKFISQDLADGNATENNDNNCLKLPVNSMGFGGMILVKSPEEMEKVKMVGIAKILSTVGLPPLREEEMKGNDDVFAEIA
jgi:ATP adenylyltransferase